MSRDVTIPVREAIEIIDAASESDLELPPADLVNLRRLVALGDEAAIVSFVMCLRDKARAQVRRSLVAKRKNLERMAAAANRIAASRRLDDRIRSIVGLDCD